MSINAPQNTMFHWSEVESDHHWIVNDVKIGMRAAPNAPIVPTANTQPSVLLRPHPPMKAPKQKKAAPSIPTMRMKADADISIPKARSILPPIEPS